MNKVLRKHPGQINDIKELLEQIEKDDLILVEIGSFMGESMELFAESGKFKKIYCIDPWQNGYDDADSSSNITKQAEPIFDQIKKKYEFVEKIKMSSVEALKLFEDESIDMVYIDGDHRPESVRVDINNWVKKVKKDGYVTGHDWEYMNGQIQPIIKETIGYPDYICKHVIHGGKSDGSWLKLKNNIK